MFRAAKPLSEKDRTMAISKKVVQRFCLGGFTSILVGLAGCSEVEDTYTPPAGSSTDVAKPVQKVNPASFAEGELIFKKKPATTSSKQ